MYGIWHIEKGESVRRGRSEVTELSSRSRRDSRKRKPRSTRTFNLSANGRGHAECLSELVCFFPIWSPTANLILEGQRRVEFRRVPPALRAPFAAILYDPAEQAIRAVMRIKSVLRGEPIQLVQKAETLDQPRGQSKEKILDYLRSAPNPGAMVIDKVIRVGPFRLDEIRRLVAGFLVPQKFIYLPRTSTLCLLLEQALTELSY